MIHAYLTYLSADSELPPAKNQCVLWMCQSVVRIERKRVPGCSCWPANLGCVLRRSGLTAMVFTGFSVLVFSQDDIRDGESIGRFETFGRFGR